MKQKQRNKNNLVKVDNLSHDQGIQPTIEKGKRIFEKNS